MPLIPDSTAVTGAADKKTCLACGSDMGEHWAEASDIEYFTTDATYNYLRCCACDCLWIHPVPIAALAEIYPANYYSYASGGESVVVNIKNKLDKRFFRTLFRDIVGDSLRVLDVGGGSGTSLNLVRHADSRVSDTVVVDLDSGAQEVAAQNGHSFFHGPVELFESDQLFDVILMLNLIEHVADPTAVMSKAHSLLKPGGRLIVKTPNWRSYDEVLFRQHSWAGYHCPRHWVLWTMPGFTTFATSCGLQVVSARYTQGAPFWAVSVLAMLAKRGLISVSAERPTASHPLFAPLAGFFALFDLLRMPFAHPSQMFFELTR